MKKYIVTLLTAASVAMSGCGDWLDINTNPNYVSDADMSMLMPTVELMTADKVGYELTLVGNFWAQYAVQNKNSNQYTTIMNYDMNTQTSYFTSPWSYIYSRVLPSIKKVLAQCAKSENASNYELEAKTMLAYNLYLLTSLYDDVAYTDSFLKEETNINPKFDTGKETQANIIALLEEIRSMDAAKVEADELGNSSAKADMVFSGDVAQWFKFANTLYLRVLMRDFNANKSKIQALLNEDNLLDEADAAFDHFANETNKSNPLYESDRRKLNTDQNIRCCNDILGVLEETDGRLSYYYENGLMGVPYGTLPTPSEATRLAIGATDAVYFATIDEACFLKAEAYARLGDSAKAQENFEAAIEAAFERCGCAGVAEALSTYAYPRGTTEEQVEFIVNHKWASNVRCMPIESWFDMNRTGYPKRGTTITAHDGVLGGVARRFLVPYTSSDYNSNSPEVKSLDTKMWWHK